MQEIEFYCSKCKKSMKMSYRMCGDDNAPVMNGMVLRCHTNKCTRAVILKSFTEGRLKKLADALGRWYM